MDLKNLFTTLKKLLGFAPPPPPKPKIPTELELTEKTYAETAPNEKSVFLLTKLAQAKREIELFLNAHSEPLVEKASSTDSVYTTALKALEWIDVWNFANTKKAEQITEEGEELVFTKLLSIAAKLAIPGKTVMEQIEGYVENHEQNLLLAEARGEYACTQSENKAWVHLPLLEFLQSKHVDPKAPREALQKIFYEIPQMQLLDIENKIPKFKTSLVDIQMYMRDKKVVPFKTTNPEYWYLYIIH